jgi:2'-5' RNA ligase
MTFREFLATHGFFAEQGEAGLPPKGYLYIDLPGQVTAAVEQMVKAIPPEQVFEYKAMHPHITVCYGFADKDGARLSEAMRAAGVSLPLQCSVGPVAVMGNPNPKKATAHFAVESPDLHRAYNSVIKLAPGATFASFKPHVTIASVKSEFAESLEIVGRPSPVKNFAVDKIIYVNPLKEKMALAL